MSDVYRVVEADGTVSRRAMDRRGSEKIFSTLRAAKLSQIYSRAGRIQVARDVTWEDVDTGS